MADIGNTEGKTNDRDRTEKGILKRIRKDSAPDEAQRGKDNRNAFKARSCHPQAMMVCHTHTTTPIYPVMPHLLDEEERRYMKSRYHRIKLCREITDKIERMDNEDEKDVLMYRYIRLMKWEDIAVKMEYSWQHLHKIHARALHILKFKTCDRMRYMVCDII